MGRSVRVVCLDEMVGDVAISGLRVGKNAHTRSKIKYKNCIIFVRINVILYIYNIVSKMNNKIEKL